MTEALLIIGALAGVALSVFVSAVETGSYCLNRVTLHVRTEQNQPVARALAAVMQRQEDLLMLTLLGNALADYVATACTTALLLYAAFSPERSELVAASLVTPVLLVWGGIVPKDWFRREADRFMYPLAPLLLWCVRIAQVTGFLWLMRVLTQRVVAWIEPTAEGRQKELGPRTRVLQLLHEGALRGGLTAQQSDMIERIFAFSNVRVARVMIQRRRAAMVAADMPREDFLRIARMAHFSRLPVYDGDPNHVIGIVNVYDVLTDDESRPVRAHIRGKLALSPAEPVSSALVRLQEARQAMAIIEDRAGHALGILTIKDLVEEIVGDIAAW